jgi:hypothetical protein
MYFITKDKGMKKLLLTLSVFCVTIHAMEQGLQVANQNDRTVDIKSPSLGKDIINTAGDSGLIILEPNSNHPEDSLFQAMRAIGEARAAREEEIIAQQKKVIKYTVLTALLLASLSTLKNIF